MEYFPYGDLDKYIAAGFSEYEAKWITVQLLEGLAIMHKNKFTHRDLKPKVSTLPRF
jgi:calcium/calmodulin-dependent protein kinase I